MPPPSAHRKRRLYPVALVCAAALALASCHGGSKHATTSTAVPSTNAKGKPAVSLSLSIRKLQVQAAGAPHPFDPVTARSIRTLVNNYIATGIAGPLFTGQPATGLASYFASTLAPRVGAKGHDRLALTDENTPVITSVTKTVKQPLDLIELQDHGRPVMIAAQFGLVVQGTTAGGPLTVGRVGNFVFEPNAHNIWYITGYTIAVTRSTGNTFSIDKATTTTAGK